MRNSTVRTTKRPLAASAPPAVLTAVEARAAPTFWRRLLRDWRAVVTLLILAVVVLVAICAPLIAPYNPDRPDFRAVRQSPSPAHLFGTDTAGRDILSRVIFGSRVSLSVAVVAVVISVTIGAAIGSLSGFFGGGTDAVLQRLTEVFMSFPTLLLMITLAAALGPSLRNAMIIIGVFGWVSLSRLMRAEILSIKERDFILAARSVGVPTPQLIWRHLLPNAAGPLIVNAVYGLQGAILAEAGLSFLGAGVPAPTPSWGNMIQIANSVTYLQTMPWAWVPPTCMLVLVIVTVSFLGDAIARAFRQ
jgi:peptide/nickel transport system permease protein